VSASKSSVTAVFAFLCLIVFCIQCCPAQEWTKDPTTWWPDPSTGLMWAGQVRSGPSTYPKLAIPSRSMYWMGLNWQQANDYCASLHVGSFADWRLPTLDEVKDAIEIIRVNPLPVCPSADVAIHGGCRDQDLAPGMKYTALSLRGGINLFESMEIWTATQSQTDSKSAWKVYLSPIPNPYLSLVEITKASVSQTDSKSTWEAELESIPSFFARPWFSTTEMTQEYMGVVCVRPMEPNLIQAAKAAEVNHPVPDLQTLQTFIPLNKARRAYQASNYQESINQAQLAGCPTQILSYLNDRVPHPSRSCERWEVESQSMSGSVAGRVPHPKFGPTLQPDFTISNDGWLSRRKDGGRRDYALPGRLPESDKQLLHSQRHNYTIMQPRIDHITTTILQQENAPLVARKAEDSSLRAALIPLIT
jgi:Protein of unknown function (DUF1566)